MKISENFFNNLEIKTYNPSKFKNQPGFKIIDTIKGLKITTFRIDWHLPLKNEYSTTIGKSFPPTAQKTSKTFQEAINTHYSVLDYLKNANTTFN